MLRDIDVRLRKVQLRPLGSTPGATSRRAASHRAGTVVVVVAVAALLGVVGCQSEQSVEPIDAGSATPTAEGTTDDGSAGSEQAPSADIASTDSSGTTPLPEDFDSDPYGAEMGSPEFALALIGALDKRKEGKAMRTPPHLKEVKECVEAAGFEYDVSSETAKDPRYLMDDRTFAQKWGFGQTAWAMGIYPGSSTEEFASELENKEQTQAPGFVEAEADCLASTGVDLEAIDLAFDAAVEFGNLIDEDPRVEEALQQWRECMAQQGYEYSAPDEMKSSFAAEAEGGDMKAKFENEKRVAVANLPCEKRYRDVYRSVALERIGEYKGLIENPIWHDDDGTVG